MNCSETRAFFEQELPLDVVRRGRFALKWANAQKHGGANLLARIAIHLATTMTPVEPEMSALAQASTGFGGETEIIPVF